MNRLTNADLLSIAWLVMDDSTREQYSRLVAFCERKGKLFNQLTSRDVGDMLRHELNDVRKAVKS